jgi:hypothetical protein
MLHYACVVVALGAATNLPGVNSRAGLGGPLRHPNQRSFDFQHTSTIVRWIKVNGVDMILAGPARARRQICRNGLDRSVTRLKL